jgi:hypothetical protein
MATDPAYELLSAATTLAGARASEAGGMASETVRACAGAFARVAADLLLDPSVSQDAWRAAVRDLAAAFESAQSARLAVESDTTFSEVEPLIRRLVALADAVTTLLESIEPGAIPAQTAVVRLPDSSPTGQETPPGDRPRRRPWFGPSDSKDA